MRSRRSAALGGRAVGRTRGTPLGIATLRFPQQAPAISGAYPCRVKQPDKHGLDPIWVRLEERSLLGRDRQEPARRIGRHIEPPRRWDRVSGMWVLAGSDSA